MIGDNTLQNFILVFRSKKSSVKSSLQDFLYFCEHFIFVSRTDENGNLYIFVCSGCEPVFVSPLTLCFIENVNECCVV